VKDDEEQIPDELEKRETGEAAEPAARAPKPPAEDPASPVLVRARPSKQWRSGGGMSRWTSYGCAAGVLVLIALLVLGVSLTKRLAWSAMDRSQRRLMAAVEQRNDPGARMRIRRNLDRFRTQLRLTRDPYPQMGEFMKRVQKALEDGDLNADELEELNDHLESVLPTGQGFGIEP
jgi:hypothetical protein